MVRIRSVSSQIKIVSKSSSKDLKKNRVFDIRNNNENNIYNAIKRRWEIIIYLSKIKEEKKSSF